VADVASPGLPFDVLVEGRFTSDQLNVAYEPTPRATTPELERRIKEEWRVRTAEAAEAGRLLFDGELLRYVTHEVRDDQFRLTVGPTCYRDFVGTNLYNRHHLTEYGWARFANPVGTTATLVTTEDLIVFGRRSDRVAWHAGYVHTFGGALEAVDRAADGMVDAFAAVRRELKEEIALTEADIDQLTCAGLIRDREIHQPELLFEARLGISFRELLIRVSQAEAGNEHRGLVALAGEPHLVAPFLRASGRVAPVAVGALLLHGRHRWGEDWYQDVTGALSAAPATLAASPPAA